MKRTLFAIVAIGAGIAVGFWVAPPFGSFAILAKSTGK